MHTWAGQGAYIEPTYLGWRDAKHLRYSSIELFDVCKIFDLPRRTPMCQLTVEYQLMAGRIDGLRRRALVRGFLNGWRGQRGRGRFVTYRSQVIGLFSLNRLLFWTTEYRHGWFLSIKNVYKSLDRLHMVAVLLLWINTLRRSYHTSISLSLQDLIVLTSPQTCKSRSGCVLFQLS